MYFEEANECPDPLGPDYVRMNLTIASATSHIAANALFATSWSPSQSSYLRLASPLTMFLPRLVLSTPALQQMPNHSLSRFYRCRRFLRTGTFTAMHYGVPSLHVLGEGSLERIVLDVITRDGYIYFSDPLIGEVVAGDQSSYRIS